MHVHAKAFGLIAAAALAGAGAPVLAQAVPDSMAFIKAVREADGGKATALLNARGSTVKGARDAGTGENGLHIAIRRRDSAWTQFLARAGVDLNALDKKGETPLGLAAQLGFTEGGRILIANGARVDGANARGETPLIQAVQARRLDFVQLLLRQGANPDKTDTAAGYSARDYAKQDRRSAPILRAIETAPARKPAGTAKVQ